jgi:hypothetical protein
MCRQANTPPRDHATVRLRGTSLSAADRFGDDVLPTRSRRSARLECIVHHLGLALGGRPAAGFAKRLMLPVSNDTPLRVVRRRTRP